MNSDDSLQIKIPMSMADRFIPLWGSGVGIVTHDGISLMDLLGNQLGIDKEYIEQRIQTIFINGRAVDRMDQVILQAGAVVALSAAMPGLVGATFRKQGILAAFRRDISYNIQESVMQSSDETIVILKLFNMIAKELGPKILQHKKVCLMGKQAKELLQILFGRDETGEVAIRWNGKAIRNDEAADILWPDGWISLRVECFE